ncbi:hypothetical protein FACS189413_13600 [Bacteroidia bacterium]|nr:hypothetical protein FACS189413_13600 [Bacteroidia bacterium]
MKSLKNLILSVLVLLPLLMACDEREYDIPNMPVPEATWKATKTIRQVLDTYKGKSLEKITDSIFIKGIVSANDISGNLYKQIQVQDETGGINIIINASSGLFRDFPVGQRVVINCHGLYYGEYGSFPQLCTEDTTDHSSTHIALKLFKEHLQKDSIPAPSELNIPRMELSDLSINSPLVGTVVTIKNVSFERAGEIQYAEAPAGGGNPQTVNRILKSAINSASVITARNSSAADFASDTLPKGIGNVTGLLTRYNNTLQIIFRDYNDCSADSFVYVGNGTAADPYSIKYALTKQDGNVSGWIEGYIVGAAAPGVSDGNPINGNDKLSFTAPFFNNSVILAETVDVKDWTKVIVVELPAGTDIRTAVNLSDNVANLGKKLKVNGTLQNKWGAAGLVTGGAAANFALEGSGPSVGDGDGSEASPYNVAQAKLKQGEVAKWVKGYIVGGVVTDEAVTSIKSGSDVVFGVTGIRSTSVLIADLKNETDYTKCVVVKLNDTSDNPADLRSKVNLVDNAGNLHKELKIQGKLEKYFGIEGVRSVTAFELTGEGTTPVDPPTPPVVGEGFFHETFGNGNYPSGNRPKLAAFTDFDMKAPYVIADQYNVADIRSTNTIDPHVWLPAYSESFDATSQLKITGIASGYTQMKLFYDIATNSANGANANKIVVKCNDVAIAVPSTTFSAANKYVTISLNIPDNTTSIEFFSDPAVNKEGYRLDNIWIDGK